MTQPADSQPVSNAAAVGPESPSPQHLRRVLGLGDLIFYGLVLIQPVGAVGPFGLADKMSFGHVTAAILIALVAMMLTAVSYGRMAGLYPAAGSAYTYVGRGLNPHLGFVAGWAMFLDYLVIPVVSVIYAALSTERLVNNWAPGFTHRVLAAGLPPQTEHVFWLMLFLALMTFLNLRGIKWTARANEILTAAMCLVVLLFVADAVRYLLLHQGWRGLFSSAPFYNPGTFHLRAVASATSLAALTYIGFDGITTLAEDVRDPKRTVPRAIVLVCLLIGCCAGLQVYLAQLVWPDYTTFKDLDTAFFDVCKLVGGDFLFDAVTIILAVACLGTVLTGQVGAARILFGMGRDNTLPRFFARLDARGNPALNIWVIGGLVLLGSLLLNYEDSALLINFGAFLAFMGVNLAAIREFYFRQRAGHQRRWLTDLALPGAGFLFCLVIWLSLKSHTQIVGGIWCGAGLLYLAIKTRGFRRPPVLLDLSGG